MPVDTYGIIGNFDPGDLQAHLISLSCRDSSDRYHRVGLTILHEIRQVRQRVDFVHVGRVVSWARGQLGGSAQPPSTIGASSRLPM